MDKIDPAKANAIIRRDGGIAFAFITLDRIGVDVWADGGAMLAGKPDATVRVGASPRFQQDAMPTLAQAMLAGGLHIRGGAWVGETCGWHVDVPRYGYDVHDWREERAGFTVRMPGDTLNMERSDTKPIDCRRRFSDALYAACQQAVDRHKPNARLDAAAAGVERKRTIAIGEIQRFFDERRDMDERRERQAEERELDAARQAAQRAQDAAEQAARLADMERRAAARREAAR